jgi:hypothetical protein
MAVGNQLPGAVQKTGYSDLSRQETPEFVSRKTVLKRTEQIWLSPLSPEN